VKCKIGFWREICFADRWCISGGSVMALARGVDSGEVPPVALHGVGDISKLYFAIFVAYNESVTLNLYLEIIKGNRFWYQ